MIYILTTYINHMEKHINFCKNDMFLCIENIMTVNYILLIDESLDIEKLHFYLLIENASCMY